MTDDSLLSYATAAGSGTRHRVVLASQIREDNCSINRLNKLANDAQVRKFLGGSSFTAKSTSKPHIQRSLGSSLRLRSKKTAILGPVSTSKKNQQFLQTSIAAATCMTTKASTRNNNHVSLNNSINMFSQGYKHGNTGGAGVSRSRSPHSTGGHKPTVRRSIDR